MKTAAGTFEKNMREKPEAESRLKLVEKSAPASGNRMFQIGIAEDLFAPVGRQGKSRVPDSSFMDSEIALDRPRNNKLATSTTAHEGLLLAAAGLALGYLVGRLLRK